MAERFLVLAPRGRDAVIAAQVLRRRGVAVQGCADLAALRAGLAGEVGGVLVTEEALDGAGLEPVLDWIEAQLPWSDLPFVVLTTRQSGEGSPRRARLLERLGNVILLERPINADTLLSAAASALRARRRQYQARQLNETLEQRVADRTLELEQARETLVFALDSAGMGTWDYDLRTDRSRRSARHDRIFGFDQPQPDWGRASFMDRVIPEDRAAVAALFEAAVETGALDGECRIQQAGDGTRWIALKGRVEYGPDGGAIRMAGIVVDITERRLTEDALRQAQKMEAIGQLTGGVAHDFNNLLTVIVGGLDMVLRRPERTERVVRLAEAAMTAARRGEQLTQQLLAFSRRQMMRPQTLDPARLLDGFRSLATRAVGETVTLRFDLGPALHPIRIDPAQFESAVLNLIVNARDALQDRGAAGAAGGRDPCIAVGCRNVVLDDDAAAERGLGPGAYVEVAVADNGPGFDDRTLTRAFEPFFTTKEVGKGSGLGLSQVYGFMRSAGGDVRIDTAPGSGTTVRLCFQRSLEPIAAEALPAVVAPLREAVGDETVLLVEDDEQVLGMAVESLEELRYAVVVARNAGEALEQLRSGRRIDLLFTDVVMPGGMNGAELAGEARRLRPGLRVLLTSGYVGEAGIGQEFASGLPLLSKPYRRDELAETLRESLARP